MKQSLMVVFALACSGVPLVAQSSDAKLIASIDSIAAAAMKGGRVAGLAVAVVKGRDTLLMKGYGLADIEDSVPIRTNTVFRIGSVTKQFTSAAIMKLVEQGKLSLDDDIGRHVPTFPTHGRRILIRHLLNHTSGIPSYTDVGAKWVEKIRLDLPHDSLLAVVKNDSLMFEPGSHMYYNNTGYYLLGVIIEKVTGKKYGDYLAETLFRPLGLDGTMYCDVQPIIPHRADGYELDGARLVNADYLSMGQPFAAGALCSTVGDLVKWTRALASGQVVSRESYARMTTPTPLTSKRPMNYAYGLVADTLGAHRVILHGGGINGFISDLRHYPDDSLVIAVLANTAPAPSSEVAAAMARTILGVPAPTPEMPKDLPMTAADRAPFLGTYSLTMPNGTKRPIRIFARGDSLFANFIDRDIRMRWQGGNVFIGPGRMQFDVSGGKATGFVYGGFSRTREAVRIE